MLLPSLKHPILHHSKRAEAWFTVSRLNGSGRVKAQPKWHATGADGVGGGVPRSSRAEAMGQRHIQPFRLKYASMAKAIPIITAQTAG